MYGVEDVDWEHIGQDCTKLCQDCGAFWVSHIYWKPGHDHCGGSRGVVTLPAQLWFDFMEEGNEED